MKLLNYVAWVCGAAAAILMILGIVEYFVSAKIFARHPANIFVVANSFLLLGILSKILKHCCCNCKCKDEEKAST